MSISEVTTGHSPRQERNFARTLYITLVVAILIGAVLFFIASRNESLNPMTLDPQNNPPAQTETPSQ